MYRAVKVKAPAPHGVNSYVALSPVSSTESMSLPLTTNMIRPAGTAELV